MHFVEYLNTKEDRLNALSSNEISKTQICNIKCPSYSHPHNVCYRTDFYFNEDETGFVASVLNTEAIPRN